MTDRPPAGDPSEVSWLSSQVQDMVRNGPRFGARKDEFLPYILVRSQPGDTGDRPGLPIFWESPDVCAMSNTDTDAAPLMPTIKGIPGFGIDVPQVGAPATLYAHVWNLGRAAAFRVRVEFYVRVLATPELIGAAWIDLGDRFTHYPEWIIKEGPSGRYLSRGCHAIVKSPQTWIPAKASFEQALTVRAFDPILDATSKNSFAPYMDRHVAERRIFTVHAESPAQVDFRFNLGFVSAPSDVKVEAVRVPLSDVSWLSLLGSGLSDGTTDWHDAQGPIITGFLPPSLAGSDLLPLSEVAADCRQQLLTPQAAFRQGCDPLQIQFHASAEQLSFGEAAVVRIHHYVNGDVAGGHTVVLLKPPQT